MSKKAMVDLLTHLSQDRKASQEFKEHPDRVMAGLDLLEEEILMLKRGDRAEIEKYLGHEVFPFAIIVFISMHGDKE